MVVEIRVLELVVGALFGAVVGISWCLWRFTRKCKHCKEVIDRVRN